MYLRFTSIRLNFNDFLFFNHKKELIAILDRKLFEYAEYEENANFKYEKKALFFGYHTITDSELKEILKVE